jgi:hypothetical protein
VPAKIVELFGVAEIPTPSGNPTFASAIGCISQQFAAQQQLLRIMCRPPKLEQLNKSRTQCPQQIRVHGFDA